MTDKMRMEQTPPPPGFTSPTTLPASDAERNRWQEANRARWESNPMRYDRRETIGAQEYSPEFYAEIDRRFFQDARTFMPWARYPFDALIPFDRLPQCDVLEIGVGNGSHAQLLASHAKSFMGIDLTSYAVESTTRRLHGAGLRYAEVRRMEAEQLTFADESFDFIWSWGVIHHSANTRRILEEMHRVLRPGGKAVVMVYHRSFWRYYVFGAVLAFAHGEIFRRGAIAAALQRHTDGALARHYTPRDWREIVVDLFEVDRTEIYGSKVDLLPLPGGRLKSALLRALPNSVARVFTSRLHMGWFLTATMTKTHSNRATP